MKILILAMARTGSTSLQKMIAKEQGLKIIFEPSYDASYDLNEQIEKDSVVKIILWRIPKGVIDEMKWWLELTSKFDKVILLARRNLKDCAESVSYMRHQRERAPFNGSLKYIWKPTPNYPEVYNMVNEYYSKMVELSKILNIDITYYEDIFDINSPDRLRTTHIEKTLL
jgi:hypothetical protein